MNRKSIIISSIVILVVAGLFGWQIPKKQKYDELVSSTSTPAFKVQAMNSDDDKFLDEVISSWQVQVEDHPSEVMTPTLKLAGYDTTVQGIVDFYTYEAKPYSFIDHDRNKQEATTLAALSMSVPITTDETLYTKSGVAYLKIKEHVVEVYTDTDDGIRDVIYYKPN